MIQQDLPPGSWDCHVHVLDPERFPYRTDRAYTPTAAKLDSLMSTSPFQSILIVQASVEDGPESLLEHLREGKRRYPERTLRGALICTTKAGQDASRYDKSYVDMMHYAGVRCLRIQCGHGGFGTDSQHLKSFLLRLAKSYCVATLGWAISIQQPLEAWASLKQFFYETKDLENVTIIADHNGCATPEDLNSPMFTTFIDMLRDGHVWVKIAALHRRSPNDIHEMKGIVQALANSMPEAILWGTDWPHVNAAVKALQPQPHLQSVDIREELETVKSWLSEDQWVKMLFNNPQRLFGFA